MKSDMIKVILAALIAIVVAMLGFWLVEAQNYVNRTDVEVMIVKESPYIVDRNLILEKLRLLLQHDEKILISVKQNAEETHKLQLVITRIDSILRNLELKSANNDSL